MSSHLLVDLIQTSKLVSPSTTKLLSCPVDFDTTQTRNNNYFVHLGGFRDQKDTLIESGLTTRNITDDNKWIIEIMRTNPSEVVKFLGGKQFSAGGCNFIDMYSDFIPTIKEKVFEYYPSSIVEFDKTIDACLASKSPITCFTPEVNDYLTKTQGYKYLVNNYGVRVPSTEFFSSVPVCSSDKSIFIKQRGEPMLEVNQPLAKGVIALELSKKYGSQKTCYPNSSIASFFKGVPYKEYMEIPELERAIIENAANVFYGYLISGPEVKTKYYSLNNIDDNFKDHIDTVHVLPIMAGDGTKRTMFQKAMDVAQIPSEINTCPDMHSIDVALGRGETHEFVKRLLTIPEPSAEQVSKEYSACIGSSNTAANTAGNAAAAAGRTYYKEMPLSVLMFDKKLLKAAGSNYTKSIVPAYMGTKYCISVDELNPVGVPEIDKYLTNKFGNKTTVEYEFVQSPSELDAVIEAVTTMGTIKQRIDSNTILPSRIKGEHGAKYESDEIKLNNSELSMLDPTSTYVNITKTFANKIEGMSDSEIVSNIPPEIVRATTAGGMMDLLSMSSSKDGTLSGLSISPKTISKLSFLTPPVGLYKTKTTEDSNSMDFDVSIDTLERMIGAINVLCTAISNHELIEQYNVLDHDLRKYGLRVLLALIYIVINTTSTISPTKIDFKHIKDMLTKSSSEDEMFNKILHYLCDEKSYDQSLTIKNFKTLIKPNSSNIDFYDAAVLESNSSQIPNPYSATNKLLSTINKCATNEVIRSFVVWNSVTTAGGKTHDNSTAGSERDKKRAYRNGTSVICGAPGTESAGADPADAKPADANSADANSADVPASDRESDVVIELRAWVVCTLQDELAKRAITNKEAGDCSVHTLKKMGATCASELEQKFIRLGMDPSAPLSALQENYIYGYRLVPENIRLGVNIAAIEKFKHLSDLDTAYLILAESEGVRSDLNDVMGRLAEARSKVKELINDYINKRSHAVPANENHPVDDSAQQDNDNQEEPRVDVSYDALDNWYVEMKRGNNPLSKYSTDGIGSFNEVYTPKEEDQYSMIRAKELLARCYLYGCKLDILQDSGNIFVMYNLSKKYSIDELNKLCVERVLKHKFMYSSSKTNELKSTVEMDSCYINIIDSIDMNILDRYKKKVNTINATQSSLVGFQNNHWGMFPCLRMYAIDNVLKSNMANIKSSVQNIGSNFTVMFDGIRALYNKVLTMNSYSLPEEVKNTIQRSWLKQYKQMSELLILLSFNNITTKLRDMVSYTSSVNKTKLESYFDKIQSLPMEKIVEIIASKMADVQQLDMARVKSKIPISPFSSMKYFISVIKQSFTDQNIVMDFLMILLNNELLDLCIGIYVIAYKASVNKKAKIALDKVLAEVFNNQMALGSIAKEVAMVDYMITDAGDKKLMDYQEWKQIVPYSDWNTSLVTLSDCISLRAKDTSKLVSKPIDITESGEIQAPVTYRDNQVMNMHPLSIDEYHKTLFI